MAALLKTKKNLIKTAEIHIASLQATPIRFQEYGVGIFNQISTKSALKKAIKKGEIKINQQLAATATFISGGELICYEAQEKLPPKKVLNLALKVLFEDAYLAVIEKPAGILVSGNHFKTIAHALAQNLQASPLADATSPMPVHRLDYATTGALLVGKTAQSIRQLNKMFEEKNIDKVYYAVCIGAMQANGILNTPVDNKPSKASYKRLQQVVSKRFKTLNLVQLLPETGRRHQLRKQLFAIKNPILGDQNYALEGLTLKAKGLYLHAYSLTFIHPFTKENMYIESALPKKFIKIFPII